MKILYDDIIFRLQKVGGISNVFSQLISFAIKDESIDLGHISTTQGDIKNIFWRDLKITKPIYFKNIPRALLQFIPISFIDTKIFAIYHATYYNLPIKKNNVKFVITIHDLGYERGLMQKGIKRYVNIFFKRLAIIQADGIICVSQSTFNDLYIFYGKHLNNKQIAVIHNGISNKFKKLDFGANSFSRNVLFVGGRQGYKNFKNLVSAIAISNEYNLVILGGGNLSENHLNFLNKIIPKRFLVFNDVSESELNQFYNKSFCLVYPSSYEGFGLPILESMAAGCPVIACANSSIPEVSGGNAVLIPNSDPETIFKSLEKLKDVEFRSNLITNGILHSKNFNWDLTYAKTKAFYEKLMSKNN